MAFSGFVEDAFRMAGRGVLLMVRLDGIPMGPYREAHLPLGRSGLPAPRIGDAFRCAGIAGRVAGVEQKGVRVRDCLTGWPCSPVLGVLTDWTAIPDGVCRAAIASEETT